MKWKWKIHIDWRLGFIAACSSLLLLFFSYLLNNSPLFTGENLSCFAFAEWTRNHFAKNTDEENFTYINTAYDRQLTTYREDNIELGNIDVTDRGKLFSLLRLLSRTNYRYIFLDIRFEKGCESDNPTIDARLFEQIRSMKNIVLVKHHDVVNMDGVPEEKMAYNDYYSTITATNFVRYQYLMGNEESMPLYAYRELTENTITRHLGIFFTSSGHLCHNSLFLTFAPENKVSNYVNLMGDDILDSSEALENLSIMADGKIVVIGDFTHDLHDTYSGLHAGGKMLASSVMALLNGRHFINGWLVTFLFFFYIALTIMAFRPKRWYEYIPILRQVRFPILRFVLSFIGYSTVLFATSFLLGLCFRWYVSFLLPSIWFSLLSSYISYKRSV